MSLGTPVSLGTTTETARTTPSSHVTTATVPDHSTVIVAMSASSTTNVPYLITDNSGLGIVWRPARLASVAGVTTNNAAIFYGWCPNGLPSGTTLTITTQTAGSSTRIISCFYVEGQARPDKSVHGTSGPSNSWSSGATPATLFANELAITAASLTSDTSSTPSGTPAQTEIHDVGVSAASGNRTLVTSYASVPSSGTAVTGDGTAVLSVNALALTVTFRPVNNITKYTTEVNADSPNHWWHLDESSGATAVDDPGVSDGTYVNTPTYSEPSPFHDIGTAITTKLASSEEITLPVSFALNSTYTFEMWFKWPVPQTSLARDNTSTGGTIFGLYNGTDQITIRMSGNSLASFSAGWVKDGQWHHLVVTRSGSVGEVYIDAQPQPILNTAGTGATVSPIHLGKNGSTTPFEDASFDEVATYSTVLSAARILAHFDAGLAQQMIEPTGIAGTGGVGQPSVNSETQNVTATGIAATGAFGSPTLSNIAGNTVTPVGINSATGGVGEPAMAEDPFIAPTGIPATGIVFGSPTLSNVAGQTITATGIAPADAVGLPALTHTLVAPVGVPPEGGVGEPGLFSSSDVKPYARVTVAITPLLNATGDPISEAELDYPTQFLDVSYTHTLNSFKTASVVLSMYDPFVENLTPYAQALRVLYYRPNDPVPEPIFWGQCNVEEDYAAGTVTLVAQDPSIRMQHHYLRIGDDALNDPSDQQKGSIHPDFRGVQMLVDAAQAPSGPVLGVEMIDQTVGDWDIFVDVERAQEIWSTIISVTEAELGPDMDMETPPTMNDGVYAWLTLIDAPMGRNLSDDITFDYGDVVDSDDTAPQISVQPNHPTTHAHVVDRDREWRTTGVAVDVVQDCGMWVDWIAADFDINGGDTTILEEIAKSHLRAYGRPLKVASVTLRPDEHQVFFYGNPIWVSGLTVGDFYMGDIIKLRASRGYRTFSAKYRITQVEIKQPGARGPVQTSLTLIPHPTAPLDIILDTDET